MSWYLFSLNRSSANLKLVMLSALAISGLAAGLIAPALAEDSTFSGNVSWYGGKFNGRKTASGEIFDIKKYTAAHRKLPFGTKILIENPRNGKTVIVKVNDRGPYAKGRVLDLSRGAAEKLGILLGGVAFVECTILTKDGASSMTERVIISSVYDDDAEETVDEPDDFLG